MRACWQVVLFQRFRYSKRLPLSIHPDNLHNPPLLESYAIRTGKHKVVAIENLNKTRVRICIKT